MALSALEIQLDAVLEHALKNTPVNDLTFDFVKKILTTHSRIGYFNESTGTNVMNPSEIHVHYTFCVYPTGIKTGGTPVALAYKYDQNFPDPQLEKRTCKQIVKEIVNHLGI